MTSRDPRTTCASSSCKSGTGEDVENTTGLRTSLLALALDFPRAIVAVPEDHPTLGPAVADGLGAVAVAALRERRNGPRIERAGAERCA